MVHRPERLNSRASSPDSWYSKNLLGQALKNARKVLDLDSTTAPDDPAPETPPPPPVATGDTVFEVDTITHLRLDTTPLPANAQTAALLAFTESVPDYHAPEVLLAQEQRADAPFMPEQGPDLIGGIVTMDDATFTTLLTLHSGGSRLLASTAAPSWTPTSPLASSSTPRHRSRAPSYVFRRNRAASESQSTTKTE